MTRVLVLHSGGLDSSVCLASAVAEYGAPNCRSISINYGQRHKKEMNYADKLCSLLNVTRQVIKLPPIEGVMLTDPTIEVPNLRYDQITGVSPTYVPFRNGLMLANAACIAQHEGFDLIYYGAHAEDAQNDAYPDCMFEFNGPMAAAIYVGTYHKVRLVTPLQWLMKSEIVEKGAKLEVPFELTWSCYKGEEKHCGACPTCYSRKEAFIHAGVKDPTEYAQ